MPWRPKVPSPTWRSFLRNHLPDIAAIDMFVVATATFHLLYALIVLSLDRRRIVHFAITPNPTQDWLARQMTEAFHCTSLSPAGSGQIVRSGIPPSHSCNGDHGSCQRAALSMAEPLR